MLKIKSYQLFGIVICLLFSGQIMAEDAPSAGASGSYAKKFQFDVVAGFDTNEPSDFTAEWEHQTSKSPVGQMSFHWNFFADKPFNLNVGGQIGLFKSVEKIAGAYSAEAITSGYAFGPIIGIGFNPGRGQSRWRFEANVGPSLATKKTQLKSPGFTADIVSEHTSLEIGGNILAQFSVSENWRILGGLFGSESDAISLGGGVSYAY